MLELSPKDESKSKRLVSLARALQLYNKDKENFGYETEYITNLFYMDLPIDVTGINLEENKIYFVHDGPDNMENELGAMIANNLAKLKIDTWTIDYQNGCINVKDAKEWFDIQQTVDVHVQAKFNLTNQTVTVTLETI